VNPSSGSFEQVHVDEVLRAADRPFVAEERVLSDQRKPDISVGPVNPIGPRLLESDSLDFLDDVDPAGRDSHLKDQVRRREVFDPQLGQRRAEFLEGCEDAPGIFF